MTDEKNIKLVVLIGEHAISRGCKFPGYSREGRRYLVCRNIVEGLNDRGKFSFHISVYS